MCQASGNAVDKAAGCGGLDGPVVTASMAAVIDAARLHLLVVGFAVYRIPRVCEALLRAADQGVRLRIAVAAGDR